MLKVMNHIVTVLLLALLVIIFSFIFGKEYFVAFAALAAFLFLIIVHVISDKFYHLRRYKLEAGAPLFFAFLLLSGFWLRVPITDINLLAGLLLISICLIQMKAIFIADIEYDNHDVLSQIDGWSAIIREDSDSGKVQYRNVSDGISFDELKELIGLKRATMGEVLLVTKDASKIEVRINKNLRIVSMNFNGSTESLIKLRDEIPNIYSASTLGHPQK
ncbi:hypothetical protein ACFOD1_03005 [Pseudidiomarina halophila]|uniref:Uncharacterized protein n=1 Tax=Pseudidiomarina halophila TaxID=1449799 RepID=A0A432XYY1_9GAMM|nr:hypothetical protein [Pseudidiomarina halophila]RUO53926.1 hypothetical protein CWI69_00345 [Pseudidiomarina halophila]